MMQLAAAELRRLLAGSPPGKEPLDQFGDWQPLIALVHAAYERSGHEGVRRAIEVAQRAKDGEKVRSLLLQSAATPPSGMPPLPEAAQQIYQHLAPCASWLDDYTAYGRAVIPTMVDSFHQTAGLFLISIAIARRLVFQFRGIELYPNLYALFVAPSGYGKSTAFGALERVLIAAGLRHLLITEQLTPENLLQQLSTVIPKSIETWSVDAQDDWLAEKAFTAQRGWAVDEAAFLFDLFTREYMTGMLGHMLRFYDCPSNPPSRETQSGGRVVLKNVSLSFFGASTPVGMRPHFQNKSWWEKGLWGRFAVIMPDSDPPWIEDESGGAHVPIPAPLVQRLRHIHTMFGTPTATLEEDEKKRPYVEVRGQTDPIPVTLAPGVYQAWQTYRKATAHDIGKSKDMDEALEGSYTRFAVQAIKVAMLLATMDSDSPEVHLELRHYATAQQMVETWRAMMHIVWRQEMKIDEERLAEKIVAKLRQFAPNGLTGRQLQQQLNKPSKAVHEVLSLLQDAGQVQSTKQGQKILWSVPT